ncbi:MAG: TonB-dependent receptor [Pseudomonadota bacterium]
MKFKPRLTAAAVMSLFVFLPDVVVAEEKRTAADSAQPLAAMGENAGVQTGVPADTRNDTLVAKPVVVTSILPDRLESVPGSFNVVDEKDIKSRQPFTMREALNSVPGINVVGEDAFVLSPNIGVRGLDPRRTSRTLLLEDGMPLFLAPYGDPSAHYSTPLERISRIEVVKGSGQVLYGPQTVGGMINFVTKPVPRNGFAGSVTALAGNNDFHGAHANLGFGGEWGGIMVDALQKKGDGIRKHHQFDIQEYTIKGQFNITERQTVIAKAGYYEEDSSVSETGLGTVEYKQDKFQAGSGKNDFFRQERKTVQLQHIFKIDDKLKLSTQAYYADTFRNSYRQVDAPGRYDDDNPGSSTGISELDRCGGDVTEANAAACGGRQRPRSYKYFGFEPRLDIKHSLFGIESDAVIGFRYHEEDILRQQFRSDDPRSSSLGFLKQFGDFRERIGIKVEAKSYYTQNTFYLGNWSLTPGVRIEDMRFRTTVDQADGDPQNARLNNSQTKVLPGFGIAWNGIANTTVFAGIHKGFAPPRPDRDLRANGPNSAIVDKTQAEESTNTEFGVRSKFYKGIAFETTLFHTDFEDIVLNNGAGTFVNGGKSTQAGIEFGGRVDFGTLYNTPHNVYVSGSYTNLFTAKFKNDGVEGSGIVNGSRLPYAPRNLASVNLGYQHPIGIETRIGVDYVGRQEPDAFARALDVADPSGTDTALSGLAGDIPSYTLLNASVNFRPVGSKVSYFASGYNLTDKEYLASRVDGMAVGRSRQVFGGVRFDF